MADHDRYRKSDLLDAFLKFAFGKIKLKYRWRRIEVFRQFLSEHYKMSDADIDSLVDRVKREGPTPSEYIKWAIEDIHLWRKQWLKNRGKKAIDARWARSKNHKK